MTQKTNNPRTLIGEVISSAMDKSITVVVTRKIKHALYGKYIKKTTKLHVHDAENKCHVGDVVKVQECRPISKTKCWMLVEVVESA
jgi:small subunit ribosomal protein S17